MKLGEGQVELTMERSWRRYLEVRYDHVSLHTLTHTQLYTELSKKFLASGFYPKMAPIQIISLSTLLLQPPTNLIYYVPIHTCHQSSFTTNIQLWQLVILTGIT